MRKYQDRSLSSLSLWFLHEGSGCPRLTKAEGHRCKCTAGGAGPTGLRNAEGSRAHGGWGREETRTGLNYYVCLNLSELRFKRLARVHTARGRHPHEIPSD